MCVLSSDEPGYIVDFNVER